MTLDRRRDSVCHLIMQESTPTENPKTPVATTSSSHTRKSIYRAVWRWHFYAGLFVIPVVVLLAVTGGIYLFKPHLEPVFYRHLWFTEVSAGETQGNALPVAQQLDAAIKTCPQTQFSAINLFADPTRTTEFSGRKKGTSTLVYVDPYSGEIAGSIVKNQMLMRRVRNLHGELMLGTVGSAIVELAACWTVVLLASGIFLWWPRGKSKWRGVFWPRLGRGKRIFWRDVHSVVAIYGSMLILTLVMTGLPWSNVWGGAFKSGLALTGQSQPAAASRRASFKSKHQSGETISLSRVLAIADQHAMTGDRTVGLPRGATGTYSVVQRPLDLSQHKFLHLDQYTGEVVSQADWGDFPMGGAAQTIGIRLHQGELFGVANLILMLLACVAIIVISISGIVMWWVRRPQGKLAAPPRGSSLKASKPITILTLVFAVFFPLVGASIIVVGVGDWLVGKWSTRATP